MLDSNYIEKCTYKTIALENTYINHDIFNGVPLLSKLWFCFTACRFPPSMHLSSLHRQSLEQGAKSVFCLVFMTTMTFGTFFRRVVHFPSSW